MNWEKTTSREEQTVDDLGILAKAILIVAVVFLAQVLFPKLGVVVHAPVHASIRVLVRHTLRGPMSVKTSYEQVVQALTSKERKKEREGKGNEIKRKNGPTRNKYSRKKIRSSCIFVSDHVRETCVTRDICIRT